MECTDDPYEIEVNVSETTVQDPSGGAGIIRPVEISVTCGPVVGPPQDPIIKPPRGLATLRFSLAGPPDSTVAFTAFRYYNTNPAHFDKGWYYPSGTRAPVPGTHLGEKFTGLTITDNGHTMTVQDNSSNDTLYIYVIEWTEQKPGGRLHTYVCDPKIKNQSGGDDVPR